MLGKSSGNRQSTDSEVLQVIRNFEKNMLENVRIYTERNLRAPIELVNAELAILREFLPSRIDDRAVSADIQELVVARSIALTPQSMGIVVKELKTRYGDQFDGQQVSSIFKSTL